MTQNSKDDSMSKLIADAVKRNDTRYLAELKAAFNKQIKVEVLSECNKKKNEVTV